MVIVKPCRADEHQKLRALQWSGIGKDEEDGENFKIIKNLIVKIGKIYY